ncbi:tRNA (adenosine(37)-N6)-threonylcarbamoyltransferase complex ATPase subunit type 1 TsaE [Bacteroidales bacterium OttesenSCG-928-K22]|nr:tRNA (adenosine(37)-N6)-threonylcarbamoyltransferase complex ATPase subunit type 1 TsaE [Bacteroidales bacterium OttesenSCG-928-K22]
MSTIKFIAKDLNDLNHIAKEILNVYCYNKIFALNGNMGAGKTTLTKAFCEQLKVVDTVNSPTFAIVNEYITEFGESVYHFDCYRLKSFKEFLDIGGEDYLYSNNYCFIEWPQIIEDNLPENYIKIDITTDEQNSTRIILTTKK